MPLPLRRRWRLARLVSVLGGLGFGAVLGSVAFVRLSAAGRIFTEAGAPRAPVGLVFGAQVYPDGTPSPFLAARLDLARRLFEAGRVEVLLVSGDGAAPEYDEPRAMRDYLVAAGVPAEKIVTDPAGLDTYDSCARARRIFGVEEALAVSQSYHIPRIVATGRWLGLRLAGVGDDTVRGRHEAWITGTLRDQLACVKTVFDLVSRRDPVLGPAQSAVRDALAR